MARPRWPNLERAVVAHLKDALAVPVFTNTGADPPDSYVVLERSGGSGIGIDKTVDISLAVHAPTRGQMWDLAADLESAMYALSASTAGEVYVDECLQVFGFAYDPVGIQPSCRASAIFALTVRPTWI